MARSRGRLFFAAQCDPSKGEAVLFEQDARHAYRILRLGKGDEIGVFHDGRRYPGVLDGGCAVRLTGPGEIQPDPRMRILLGVGRPKAQAATTVVELATALGAAEIAFIQAERSVAQGSTGRDRWIKAARETCKQCGRYEPPDVTGPYTLRAWIERVKTADVKLRLSESEGGVDSLHLPSDGGVAVPPRHAPCDQTQLPGNTETAYPSTSGEVEGKTTIAVLCGPEGGFTQDEERAADEAGFAPISLGPLVLRVEHAIAAVLGRLAPCMWDGVR